MCWTHVWMRDGILPLNREGLETTSTIKTWVSQMGQAALLFSSEKLLMAPPSKCHLHCFPHWVRFNCLVLLDNPWHGTERSLSGCPFTFCKLRMPSATARALMILALSTSLKLSSVCQEQSWGHWGGQGAQRVAGDTSAPREMLMPEQQEAQWGGDRPAQGMPGPVLQPLTARCVQVHVPALSHLVWQPQMPTKCQQQCALGHLTVFKLLCVPEHVCWWQPVLQCLGTGPGGQFGDRSIMETPSMLGGLIFHNKPSILLPNPATLHHKSSARDAVSGISGSTGVRYGGKKARERRDRVACLAPVNTALCRSC